MKSLFFRRKHNIFKFKCLKFAQQSIFLKKLYFHHEEIDFRHNLLNNTITLYPIKERDSFLRIITNNKPLIENLMNFRGITQFMIAITYLLIFTSKFVKIKKKEFDDLFSLFPGSKYMPPNAKNMSESYSKKISLVFFMSCPGAGKSYFINKINNQLSEHSICQVIISSDELQKSLINLNTSQQSNQSISEIKTKAMRTSKNYFENKLGFLHTFIKESSFSKFVIFIDKNFTGIDHNWVENTISKQIDPEKEFSISSVILVNKILRRSFFTFKGQELESMMTPKIFLDSYLRIIRRENHPTLLPDPLIAVSLLRQFYMNFRRLPQAYNHFNVFQLSYFNTNSQELNELCMKKLSANLNSFINDQISPETFVKMIESFYNENKELVDAYLYPERKQYQSEVTEVINMIVNQLEVKV